VVTFDRAVGLGTVSLEDGREIGFHATAIIDGSRSIAVGADVLALLGADHGGAVIARQLAAR
jgi:cold shock CspA family protein